MEQTNFGKDFVQKVLPKLNNDEKIGLFDFAAQVEEQGKAKAKQTSQSLNAQRKQGIVDRLYNGGQPQMQQMQLMPPMDMGAQ